MAAGDFIWRDPEAAKQAIAMMQRDAALAEIASRQEIERERTQQHRYATAAQIAENEKDRQVRREDISSRSGIRTSAATDAMARERADIQYSTVLGKLNVADPLTKRELEAALVASPSLTDDQRNQLRSIRDEAYKMAKSNAAEGDRKAKNWTLELDKMTNVPKGQFVDQKARLNLVKQINGDKDVSYDAATGQVVSRHKMPREDAAETGTGIAPAQDYGGASASSAVPTIGDMKKRVSGVPAISPDQDYGGASSTSVRSISPAQDYGGAALPPTRSEMLGPPDNNQSYDREYLEQITPQVYGPPYRHTPQPSATPPDFMDNYEAYGIPRTPYGSIPVRNPFGLRPPAMEFQSTDYLPKGVRSTVIAPPMVTPYESPPFIDMSDARMPRVADLAQPYGPPDRLGMFNAMPRAIQAPSQRAANVDYLIRFTQHPRFQTLAPQDQRAILDEIGNASPRMYDMQTTRPEYRPPLDYYMTQ